MTPVFCDTSGFFAVANPADPRHAQAAAAWKRLVGQHRLVTSNYVVVESVTLMQARGGIAAARTLSEAIAENVDVAWIDPPLHDAALRELFASSRPRLSLVDCTSFELMRRHHIAVAFAYDAHFAERGFAPFVEA